MDETTKYNCDKIFNIANHIYNSVKRGLTPSGLQVDYTSIKSIWTSFIGINITLTQEEFNFLNNKCKYLNTLLDKIEYILYTIKALDITQKYIYINDNASLFDLFLDDFNNAIDSINDNIQHLQRKDISKPSINLEKDDIIKGTEWINILFDFYLKYEGKKQVSTSEFFYHIKDIWKFIENSESIQISYILENIFGGGSIKNLSYNLRDWLMKNGDVVTRRDIINLSLSPIIVNKTKQEDVVTFDPLMLKV